MRCPRIGAMQFLVLSALLYGPGRPRREIIKHISWSRKLKSFDELMRKLHRFGFVQKSRVVRIRNRVETDAVWSITIAGREVWRETADFYLWTIEHIAKTDLSGSTSHTDDSDPVVFEEEIPFVKKNQNWRKPTSAEEQRLLANTKPEFVRFYRMFVALNISIEELASAEVEDVADNGRFLHINGQVAVLNEGDRSIVIDAIGDRTAGPLLLRPNGKCWLLKHVLEMFSLLRKQAGIPFGVTLAAGGPGHVKHRKKKQPVKQRIPG